MPDLRYVNFAFRSFFSCAGKDEILSYFRKCDVCGYACMFFIKIIGSWFRLFELIRGEIPFSDF
jgi:hypothetical protein